VVKDKLRKISLCLALGLGSLVGLPMPADEIEELMHQMREPKLAHTLADEGDKGDGPPSS
jgi:hypothetical protein